MRYLPSSLVPEKNTRSPGDAPRTLGLCLRSVNDRRIGQSMKHWREGRRQQVEARRKKTKLFALCDGNEGETLAAGGPSLLCVWQRPKAPEF